MMVERDGHLDQTLEKLLFGAIRFPPHIFPSFVSVEKIALVEQLNAATVQVYMHWQIVAF
jgi:hypothetical protein